MLRPNSRHMLRSGVRSSRMLRSIAATSSVSVVSVTTIAIIHPPALMWSERRVWQRADRSVRVPSAGMRTAVALDERGGA